jgi:hypothetical protein
MKIIITTSLVLLSAIFSFSVAQEILPARTQIQHNEALRPCWEVTLPTDKDPTKEAWNDFLRDAYDLKLKGLGLFANKDFLHAEEVMVESLSDLLLNFYTSFETIESGDRTHTKMSVFISFGYDVYAGPDTYSESFNRVKEIIEEFLLQFLPVYFNEAISENQDRISDLKGDMDDLQKDIAKNEKEIEELKKENEEARESLINLQVQYEDANKSLTSKRQTYEGIKRQLEKLSKE